MLDIFTLEGRVSRREYLTVGATLMSAKYVLDASVIRIVTGLTWTPLDYLAPMWSVKSGATAAFPTALSVALLLWTLVFAWVGVAMTFRRINDAGMSPWLVLWFFVPFVNYLMMLLFAALPHRDTEGHSVTLVQGEHHLRSALRGLGAGLIVAMAGLAASVYGVGAYGITLFVGLPVVAATVTAYVFNREGSRPQPATDAVVVTTLLMIGGVALLFAMEGIICLFMALPLALILGLLGSRIGRRIAVSGASRATAAAAFLVLPSGLFVERVAPSPTPTSEVVTSIEVNASPGVVWEKVVQFGEIDPPTEWYFRAGIAYPTHASIAGSGVGAVRRCEFSTGAFIEPITVWEPGSLLAFSVEDQPSPLQEWSPYSKVFPPHLNGYFVSERGEFRLRRLANGHTLLEGHTWYHHRIQPQQYWRLFSEPLLHSIHRRVLSQVKREAEQASQSSAGGL